MKANLLKYHGIPQVAAVVLFTLLPTCLVLAQDGFGIQDLWAQARIHTFLLDAARLATWLLPLALVFIPLEHLFARRPPPPKDRDPLQNLAFYFINGLVPGLMLAAPLAAVAIGAKWFMPEAMFAWVAAWPLWLRVALALVINELGTYWGHRMMHAVPFLWRFHAIHHSPEQLYFLSSTFAHPIDKIVLRACGLAPVFLLGIASPFTSDGRAVSALLLLTLYLWGFFIHSNLKWRFGVLEWIVATPGYHHWHHTRTAHRDRNFAPMLPLIDWAFGTLYLPGKQWPAEYGIETPLPTTLGGRLLHPFKQRVRFNSLPQV